MNLIDKDTLIAKIEKRRNENQNVCTPESSGAYYEDGFILDTINSINIIKVEEVDLEKEIDAELRKRWYGEYLDIDKFYESAKHFFKLGLQVQKG